MDEEDFKNGGASRPRLLDLIPNEEEQKLPPVPLEVDAAGEGGGVGRFDAKNLELRLGLPGEDEDDGNDVEQKPSSVLSLALVPETRGGLFRAAASREEGFSSGMINLFFMAFSSFLFSSQDLVFGDPILVLLLGLQNRGAIEFLQHQGMEREEKLNFCCSTRSSSTSAVGWPPVCSFRKNAMTGSVKQPPADSENENAEVERMKLGKKNLLIKINMDGVPIGRKVDLDAIDCYEKLSLAVEELFIGLLPVDSDANTSEKKEEAKEIFRGMMDGSGEFTLVYEDTGGDKMPVGEVPWEVFLSTVRRLRVLKSSDISILPEKER